jgi:endonuclease YncB( thermonuclease family)
MLLGGLFAGLIAYQSLPPTIAFGPNAALDGEMEPPPVAGVDPYAESRRSRAILEAQEGPPPRLDIRSFAGERYVRAAGPVRVIDGDTFIYAGERIRIADIDTPEVHGRCPYETALAARATRRMRGLLAQGPFELHPLPNGQDRDSYGRQLRIVTRRGRSLGNVLVREGLARTWSGRRRPWCRQIKAVSAPLATRIRTSAAWLKTDRAIWYLSQKI